MEKTAKYSNKKEILRFIVVGLIATVVDFVTKILITSAIGNSLDDVYKQLIGYTCGFILGVTINYILSTFWVFKNVDSNQKTKSAKSVIIFILLSLVGFGIGLGIFYGLGYAFLAGGIDILNFSIFEFYKFITEPTFYLYTLVFCIQTLVVLFWNYISRKKLIYKAPKDESNQK
jgi:putative flippase GtrA